MIVPLTQILLKQDINLPFYGSITRKLLITRFNFGSVLLLLLAFLIRISCSYYQFWQFKFAEILKDYQENYSKIICIDLI